MTLSPELALKRPPVVANLWSARTECAVSSFIVRSRWLQPVRRCFLRASGGLAQDGRRLNKRAESGPARWLPAAASHARPPSAFAPSPRVPTAAQLAANMFMTAPAPPADEINPNKIHNRLAHCVCSHCLPSVSWLTPSQFPSGLKEKEAAPGTRALFALKPAR